MIDETGNQYGYLIVKGKAPLPNRNKMGWLCECQLCGNTKVISGSDLREGKYCSCGCKKQNIIQEQPGTKYGYLEIIKQDPTSPQDFADHCTHWICKCSLCGKICSISGRSLRNGRAKSCGCMRSYGENLINQYLIQNKINFCKEFQFDNLKDKHPLRFDYALFDKNNQILCLIEFNGVQHYRKNCFSDPDKFDLQRKHDLMKINYCKNNNIHLYIMNNEKDYSGRQLEERILTILEYILFIEKEKKVNGKIFDFNLRDISSRH